MGNDMTGMTKCTGGFAVATAVAAMFAIATPGAGTAHAHGYSTPSGDAVGRPGLDNPAPLMRLAQAFGDHLFNQNTPANRALDDSLLGQNYHAVFGTPNYTVPTHGHNGTFTGVLNVAGPLRDNYNSAQSAGQALPEESHMSGMVVRFISGVPVAAPHTAASISAASVRAQTGAFSRGDRAAALTNVRRG